MPAEPEYYWDPSPRKDGKPGPRGWVFREGNFDVSLKVPYGRLPRGFYWVDLAPEDQSRFNEHFFQSAKGQARIRRTSRNEKDGWEWVLWEQLAEPADNSTPYPTHLPRPNTGRADDTYDSTHERPVITPTVWVPFLEQDTRSAISTGAVIVAGFAGIALLVWAWRR